jgi:broad specificity phosphatase PhoE
MVAHVHLVRHGHHALLGHTLCGRMPGVLLDARGCREMDAIAGVIESLSPQAIQCSPQRRTLQSATILAARCGRAVEIVRAVDEINLGRWTGARFADLRQDPAWQRWNERRGSAKPPGGESMGALQRRVVAHIEQLADRDGAIVIVSHAEPIRAALMYYLGVPLDLFHTVEIDTASISTIALEGKQALVSRVNHKVSA